jgi:hypothetical protein
MRVRFPLLGANDAAETFPIWRNRDFHFPTGDRLRLFRDYEAIRVVLGWDMVGLI